MAYLPCKSHSSVIYLKFKSVYCLPWILFYLGLINSSNYLLYTRYHGHIEMRHVWVAGIETIPTLKLWVWQDEEYTGKESFYNLSQMKGETIH